MTDFGTGLSGFIGSKLAGRLPDIVPIPHRHIQDFKYEPCDRFFFLSTYGNMIHHEDIGAMVRANLLDVHHVLTHCKPNLFVFVSTSSVNLPVQTPYSLTKKAGEDYVRGSGVPYCIVRPYSVVGVGEQKEHLIPRLIESCLKKPRLRINFVPDPVHDFVDVEDVVDGILFLADNNKTGTYEIGKGLPWSNGDVKRLVEDACGGISANVRIGKTMRPYDNLDWRCKDKIPGWMPRKSLIHSIAEMVEAYKEENFDKEYVKHLTKYIVKKTFKDA